MAKIKIVVDSASDITPNFAKKYDLDVIPMNIFFGDEKFKEGINITAEECYKRLETQKDPWPKTSQPSPKDFHQVYEKHINNGIQSIFSIHLSSDLSGTLNSVHTAKQMFPGKDIIPIDSRTVTHPYGLIIEETAKMLKKTKSKEKVLTKLKNTYIPNAHICGIVNSLEYVYRGGRIGKAKKILGTLLNKKPLLQVKDGVVDSFGTVKGFEEGFKNFVNMVPIIFDNLITNTVWLGYAGDSHNTMELYDAIKDLPNKPKNLEVRVIGPAVGTHLGPGAMTIAWLGKWNEKWYFGKK